MNTDAYEEELQELFGSDETDQFIGNLRTSLADEVSGTGYVGDMLEGALAGAADAVDETLNFGLGFVGRDKGRILPEFDRPVTAAGEVTDDMTQFIVGLAGAGKLTNSLGVIRNLKEAGLKGKLAKGMLDSAMSSTIAHNPYDKRLADIVQQYPATENVIADWLQGKDDDSMFELRMKMAMEDVIVNGAVTGALTLGGKATAKLYKNWRDTGKVDEAAEAELKEAGKQLEEAAQPQKPKQRRLLNALLERARKDATKEATEDVSEAGTATKAEVQETPTAKTKSDTPKKDSPESVDAELPATPKLTKKKANEVVKALRTAEGDEKSFDELQENVDSFMYNILQTRRSKGQAEHTLRYTKIWMSSIRALDGKLWT